LIPTNDNVSFYYKLKALHKFVGRRRSLYTRQLFFPKKLITGWKKPLEKKKLTRNLWIRHVHSREKRFQGSRGVAYL
jgi:hypothetical protein